MRKVKSRYNLINTKSKILAIILALVINAVLLLFVFNDYLQANMLGDWTVTNTEINYSLAKVPKDVTIFWNKIKIDGAEDVPIKYPGRHTSGNFSRKKVKTDLIYYFEGPSAKKDHPDHVIIYNKAQPKKMLLVIFSDDDHDVFNLFQLSKK
ncbi:hypothetical protein [Lapidilactobacillus bayanensis]|uniref:hypothetical protein n=1 Tax=Lapidilactobacillus bayanensis TaxID=2485998 RepID=UPI000F795762|nr:hypothetical protein [Lapidilactobacillus bayanensis]